MFLFKNTKSLVKRIGMNMAVYGWAGAFISMFLSLLLDKFEMFFAIIFTLFGLAGISGVLILFIYWLAEPFITSSPSKKAESKPVCKSEVIHICENIYIENGKLLSYGQEISVEQARKAEEQYVCTQAYLSVVKDGRYTFEEAEAAYGIVRNSDGTRLKEYKVNKYIHKIKNPKTQGSVKYSEKTQNAVFKTKTQSGQHHSFEYCGHSRYSPNRSTRCGYGSDDWYYLCKENNLYYLLMFTDNAEFGTAWMFTRLLEGDYDYLINTDADFWAAVAYSKERKKTYNVHLTEIDSVKHLLPTSSRCSAEFTSQDFLR